MSKDGTYNQLTLIQRARWMALLTAIDHIDNYCDAKNKNFDEEVCLKPIPIKHFIEEQHRAILHQLQKDQQHQDNKDMVYNIQSKILKNIKSVSKI